MDDDRLRVLHQDWDNCTRCPLGERAFKHVLYEAEGPIDLLCIGEGPGEVEDVKGFPFRGPTGKLLREALKAANGEHRVRIGFTNMVACRPQEKSGGSNRAPAPNEIQACAPRLLSVVQILKPYGVLLLGRIPQSYYRQHIMKCNGPEIYTAPHPSWVKRRGDVGSEPYLEYVNQLEYILHNIREEIGIGRQVAP